MFDAPPAIAPAFVLRLQSVDELFEEFDGRPVAERPLRQEVHDHLLDAWERVRAASPAALTLVAPAVERAATDEEAVRAAIHAELRASRGPLRRAGPLSRSERVSLWAGVLALLVSIAVSTWLEDLTDDVLVEGVAQGITVVGWVALWTPAQHFFNAIVPHAANRRRYRELADLEVDFNWV